MEEEHARIDPLLAAVDAAFTERVGPGTPGATETAGRSGPVGPAAGAVGPATG